MCEWGDIKLPWFEVEGFAGVIVDKVRILDICDKWGLEYSKSATGNFTHRMKCPFPIHDYGGERTASLFISETNNSFYCFGCSSGGDIIKFVSLYTGKPYHESLRYLSSFANITSENIDGIEIPKKEKVDKEKLVSTHVFRAGVLIRDHLKAISGKQEYDKWVRLSDKIFVRLDEYLGFSNDKWERAKAYHDKISDFIKRET